MPPGPPRLERLEKQLGNPKGKVTSTTAAAKTTPLANAATVTHTQTGPSRDTPGSLPEPPAVKKPAKAPADGEPPGRGGGGGSSGKVVGAAASAAQRTFSSVLGQVNNKLMQIAGKDPEVADAIADINKLMDAQAFLQNPKQFSAQYISNYLINGAFGKLSRQLAAGEAQFFSTYPDIGVFNRRALGQGMSLDGLRMSYEQAVNNLRLPNGRKALVTVFVMLGVTDSTPQKEIDQRIRVINEYLARQPGIGGYVKQYNEAKQNYAFGLMIVRTQMDNLSQQLGELPAGFADDIRRRGDALYRAARILDDHAKQFILLSALPGADMAVYMFQTLSDGFSHLGEMLRLFAYRAGARQGEYRQEIQRLENRADQLARVRGAFDEINPHPSR